MRATTAILSVVMIICCCYVACSEGIFRTTKNNRSAHKRAKTISQTSEELMTIFSSSIVYWDVDNSTEISDAEKVERKQEIMEKLVHPSELAEECSCPRTFDDFVCSSIGKLHASICNFHCEFGKSETEVITPTMIFTETSYNKSKGMCQQNYLGEKALKLQGRSKFFKSQ